jgi:hypothetical protein
MRPGPAWAGVPHAVTTTVEAWRDGDLLAEAVPVVAGEISTRITDGVPRQLRLTVPADWQPVDTFDPLAPYGQRLAVSQTLTVGSESHTIPLGWFLVQGVTRQGEVCDVEALDLMQLLADFRFLSPERAKPADTATKAQQLETLAAGLLPVDVQVPDQPMPKRLVLDWVEDRLGAVYDLAAAWDCDVYTDDDGTLVAAPRRVLRRNNPDVEWTHGTASAYVRHQVDVLRDDIYNGVVVRGDRNADDLDKGDFQVVAKDTEGGSPTLWGGPFGKRPRFYASPTITTRKVAERVAQRKLQRALLRRDVRIVEAPPDPRVQDGDTATVTTPQGTVVGQIIGTRLPLTPEEGAAEYEISTRGFAEVPA